MRVLANENFPRPSILLLRQVQWDVASVSEDSPGAKDSRVLANAAEAKRIILTFDRDYGELIFRLRSQSLPAGVIYFRYLPHNPEEPGQHLLKLQNISKLRFEDKFTVLRRQHIRQRPLRLVK